MKAHGVSFNFITFPSAPAGLKYGRFDGEDEYTTKEGERLVRLPMYGGIDLTDHEAVIKAAQTFFAAHR